MYYSLEYRKIYFLKTEKCALSLNCLQTFFVYLKILDIGPINWLINQSTTTPDATSAKKYDSRLFPIAVKHLDWKQVQYNRKVQFPMSIFSLSFTQ